MKQWFLIFTCLFCGGLSFAQSPYNAESRFSKDIGFGIYLLQSGQYELASLEFERINFYFPDNDTVRSLLLRSYRLGNQPVAGLNHCLGWFPWMNPWMKDSFLSGLKPIEDATFRELCILLIDIDSNELLNRVVMNPQAYAIKSSEYRNNMIVGSYMLTQKWEKAENALNNCPACRPELRTIYNNRDFERGYKNPVIAMTLSAVLPGSGKIYAGKWRDALFSLLFVASNGYASYRGFSRDGIKSPYGWIFGSFGLGFYFGNIYGSGQVAKGHNQTIMNRVKDQTRHVLRNLE